VKSRIAALPFLIEDGEYQLLRSGWSTSYANKCVDILDEAVMRLRSSKGWQPILMTVDGATNLFRHEFSVGDYMNRSWLRCAAGGWHTMASNLNIATVVAGTFIEKHLAGMRTYNYVQYIRATDVWGLLR